MNLELLKDIIKDDEKLNNVWKTLEDKVKDKITQKDFEQNMQKFLASKNICDINESVLNALWEYDQALEAEDSDHFSSGEEDEDHTKDIINLLKKLYNDKELLRGPTDNLLTDTLQNIINGLFGDGESKK